MKSMNESTVKAINQALLFAANREYEKPAVRPWQYMQMEYERVGLMPPVTAPRFDTVEDAQIWMCLDSRYNNRLRETAWVPAAC
ncbi:MAG: hypothetical protein K6E17_00010 [Clostridiales bacterium]|nr:hypothetical protein [Clostridiales bacterium]